MRRRGLWAACVVLLVGVGVVAVAAVSAKGEDAEAKCSAATLHGRYLFAENGVDITENNQVPFAIAGYQVSNGNGKLNGISSANFNGDITRKEPFSGTYTVKANCTGTVTYTDGSQYDLFIAPDGSMFTYVQTNPPEFVTSAVALQATAKRVGD